jgi:hypothetical protein
MFDKVAGHTLVAWAICLHHVPALTPKLALTLRPPVPLGVLVSATLWQTCCGGRHLSALHKRAADAGELLMAAAFTRSDLSEFQA